MKTAASSLSAFQCSQPMTIRDYAVLFCSLGVGITFGAVVETASRMLPECGAVWYVVRTSTGFTQIRLLAFGFALSRLNVAATFTRNGAAFHSSTQRV